MIEVELNGQVATLAMARPKVRNALNAELLRALAGALDRFERDSAVRVVVLTGRGKAFSAGADLNFMRKMHDAGQQANRENAVEMGRLFHRLAGFPKPVLAQVAGPAIGGGVGLMAACDIVVAADTAAFAFREVKLGLVPAVISPFCMRRLGPSVTRRLFLTGERFSAADALRYGLVDLVLPEADLDAAVARLAAEIIEGGPEALAQVKALVETVSRLEDREALAYTARLIARLRASGEAQEGMLAFLEKRKPSWLAKKGN